MGNLFLTAEDDLIFVEANPEARRKVAQALD
jgi:hypothetical protein